MLGQYIVYRTNWSILVCCFFVVINWVTLRINELVLIVLDVLTFHAHKGDSGAKELAGVIILLPALKGLFLQENAIGDKVTTATNIHTRC